MNNEPLTFDIETLPSTDKQVIERIAANISPPGNIKKKMNQLMHGWRQKTMSKH